MERQEPDTRVSVVSTDVGSSMPGTHHYRAVASSQSARMDLDPPARKLTRRTLCIAAAVGLAWWLLVPHVLVRMYGRPNTPTTCQTGWWGCEQNALDHAFTAALVVVPLPAGLVSHLFTVACMAIALHVLRSSAHGGLSPEDFAVYVISQLGTLGANNIAKDGFLRQRPCYYDGRENETEAGVLEFFSSGQEWKSFWSGDTSIAWSLIAAGVALLTLYERYAEAHWLATRGGMLAFVGSFLRIVGYMHWLTDVLAGAVVGCLCGGGMPLALWPWVGGRTDETETSVSMETGKDETETGADEAETSMKTGLSGEGGGGSDAIANVQ